MAAPVIFPFKATGQKDVENAFKSIASSAESSSKSVIKSVNAQDKAITQLAKKTGKAAADLEKDRVKAAKSSTDQIISEYEKQAKAAEKLAERMDKAFDKVKNKSKGGGVKDFAIGSMLGGIAKDAVTKAYNIVDSAVRESVKLDEMANRISIAARGHGQKGVSKSALRKSFEQTAMETPGIKSEEVAAGTAAFVSKTGRLDIAQQMQGTFATAASASGAKVEEIATAAADLFEKFDIKTIDEMQGAFAKLIFQGKEGSFELKDAASQFAKLSAAASSFNIGKGQQAVATLGGLTQIAKRATGSPEQAATAVESMFSHLTQNQTKLKGMGVNVFDKSGASRNIQDILVDAITNIGKGDMAKKKAGLQQVLGEQGIRAVNPLTSIFEEAFRSKKAEKGATEQDALAAGAAALRAEFEKTINVSASWSEVQKDAAQAQTDSSAQLNAAWESVKAKVGEDLLPAITSFITKLVGGNDVEGAIDPVITVFTAIAEAGGLVIDAFKELGIIKAKEKDPIKEEKKAKEELEKFNKSLPAGPLTLEQAKKQDELQAKVDATSKAAWSGGDTLTKESFAKRMKELATGDNKESDYTVMAQDIAKGKTSNDFFQKNFAGENQAQTNLRHQFESQVMSDKIQKDFSAKQEAAAAKQSSAADKQIEAATALKEAATTLNNGSSAGGGAQPGSNVPHSDQ